MDKKDIDLLLQKIRSNALPEAEKGWIQKVTRAMERNNTKGSFREWCGGKVTDECIERGLKSKNPKIRRRAALAKAFRNMRKKEEGGTVPKDGYAKTTSSYIQQLRNMYLSKLQNNMAEKMEENLSDVIGMLKDKNLIPTDLYNSFIKKYGGSI